MQAAAVVAEAAATTATVAGAEGLPVAINFATTAAPQVMELTSQAATAATEAAAPLAKAGEVGATIVEKVEPAAIHAAETLDLAAEEGAAAPVKALQEFAAAPVADAKNAGQVAEVKGVVSSETSTIAAEWADQKHTEIFQAVQPQMAEWDKLHPVGNNIPEWIDQRAAAEKQFTVNEAVNRDLEEWKFHNPEPDGLNDKVSHEKWEKLLATQASGSRQANETSYDQFLEAQVEKNREMPIEEFKRKYAQLRQMRAAADKCALGLQTLRATAGNSAQLATAENELRKQRAEIQILESTLQFDAAKSGSLLKQFIIPAAEVITLAAVSAESTANEG